MCARLGMVNRTRPGQLGAATVSHWVLWGACLLLVVAKRR